MQTATGAGCQGEQPAGASSVSFGLTASQRELLAAIPRACFERSLPRQLLGLAGTIGGCVVAWGLLAVSPWWLWPVLWLLAGASAFGLLVIGHECGHGSFSPSVRLNHFMGHLVMTPLLYPFHGWRLTHNIHHLHTNSLEQDLNWRPLTPAIYRRLPARPRITYRLVRTWLFWLGSLLQLFATGFDASQLAHRPGARRQMRRSARIVTAYGVVFFVGLTYWTGPLGVLRYFVGPWLVAYSLFSLVTLLQHTHPRVPFLPKEKWSQATANLCLTLHVRYPRLLEWLMHDLNVHIPHHVAPRIPFFHLRTAHEALKRRWPEHVREYTFSPALLRAVLGQCHVYDRGTGLYTQFIGHRGL